MIDTSPETVRTAVAALQIAQWASGHEMVIVLGMWEQMEYQATPVLHNSAVLIGPEGYIGV